jgi:hypothetical protein
MYMKIFHFISFLFICCFAFNASAQVPQGIPYQAIARNSSGAILASTAISVRFTIRDSIATGAIKYRETFSVTTSAQGMFSVNVGQGTPVTGTFSGTNWGVNSKFMQVEMDPAGGSSYIDMGTQQMMSVPYSLNSGSLKLRVSATGDTLYSGGGNYVIIPGISAANCFVSAGTITGSSTVGVGTTVALTNATTGGVWSSSNISVASVGSTGVVTGIAAGTATISYTKTLACGSATTTLAVTVTTLTIGATYGGGKIAYIFAPGDPGYVSGEVHGLIAASSDQSSNIQWGCMGVTVGSTSTALGTGATNTSTLFAICGAGTAARLCDDLILGGFSDWYLPSRDELIKLYINRVTIGGFAAGNYWTSSESNVYYAWFYGFGIGATGTNGKDGNCRVRAVRSF